MLKHKWLGVFVLGVSMLFSAGEGLSQGNGPVVLTATLTGSQAIPGPVEGSSANAIGSATMLFDPSDNRLTLGVAYSGLSGPATVAHFHPGLAGETGGPLQTICGAPAPALIGDCPAETNGGYLQATWTVPSDQVGALLSGGLYINIHTQLNGPGEIRGQVLPQ